MWAEYELLEEAEWGQKNKAKYGFESTVLREYDFESGVNEDSRGSREANRSAQ